MIADTSIIADKNIWNWIQQPLSPQKKELLCDEPPTPPILQQATHARVPALATDSTAAGPFVPVPYVAVGIRRATAGSRLLAQQSHKVNLPIDGQ